MRPFAVIVFALLAVLASGEIELEANEEEATYDQDKNVKSTFEETNDEEFIVTGEVFDDNGDQEAMNDNQPGSTSSRYGWRCRESSCYYVFTRVKYSWTAAMFACRYYHRGHLVIINDPAENEYVKSIARGNGYLWIGLQDFLSEGHFKWLDNSWPSFTYWNVGEPNSHGDEDCVHMYSDKGGGRWNDKECDEPLGYICERRQRN